MAGLPTGHMSLKGHLFKLGLVNSTVEMQTGIWNSLTFFVTVRQWWYYELGTWPIISLNKVTLPTSLSIRYCTWFQVQGCWML